MHIVVRSDAEQASRAAADELCDLLVRSDLRTLVVAGGNSPRRLYELVASRRLDLTELDVFTLDEYVGVPPDDPRTCANLLRREVAEAWNISPPRFHSLSSRTTEAASSLEDHQRTLTALGGIDVAVLGLGQNGHLGFNEPPTDSNAPGRELMLTPISIAANQKWFGGDYAPDRGVTLGMRDLLAAKTVLLVAFGPAKTGAVRRMTTPPPGADSPASWLLDHPDARVFLDCQAAGVTGTAEPESR